MRYSLIVPVYKVEAYLSQCIESILAQTNKDFELILVDDGSPDDCPQICDTYAEKDARVKVIHKQNGGLVSARKAGLKIANGHYICFVDGDDFVSADMLETYRQEFEKNNVDIICASYSAFYEDSRVIPVKQNILAGYYDKDALKSQVYPSMLSRPPFFSFQIMPSLCTKCFKKDLLEKCYHDMPENITLGEDVATSYPALLEASSVSVIDYYGYMYRQNQSSMTHTYDKGLYEKTRNLIAYLKRIETERHWNAENQINEYALFLLILGKNNEFKLNGSEEYCIKRRNLKKYLSDPLFKDVIWSVKVDGLRNKFILNCFKYNFLLPIYLYEAVRNMRQHHE